MKALGIVLAVFVMVSANTNATSTEWPDGKSPTEVGNKAAGFVLGQKKPVLTPNYASAASYYGILLFADQTNNRKLLKSVVEAYEPFRVGKKLPTTGHVDNNVFGIVPLELYHQSGKGEYLATGLLLAEEEWANPREDSLTRYTRWFLDDPFMVGNLQAQAYKNTKEIRFIDRGVKFQLAYFKRLRQPSGLFHHRVPEWPVSWSRGHGWTSVGMTEMLLAMPEDHPLRDKLMDEYLLTMETLIKYKKESGMWGEHLNIPDSRPETSGTGMIIFAIANGVDQGWLPADPYKKVVERAWLALTDYVDEKGAVSNISHFNMNLEPPWKPWLSIGNMHGQCAVLWAATAIERMNK